MNDISPTEAGPSVPMANLVVAPARAERWLFVATLVSLCLLTGMLIYSNTQSLQSITIRFPDGHGLKPGDPIKHRGIDVGRAVTVKLDPSLARVVVQCDLFPGAESLARGGSQFWIVRPAVSLSGVQGLETLMGGRYVAVIPGPPTAEPRTEFDGLAESPGSSAVREGGLEIVLEAPQRFGLDRGTPVLFRGMRVGEVVSVALSSDSLSVEARAIIAPEYRALVRENSVFWKDSGVNMHLGIRGFDLDVGTLESFAAGGVAVATPDPPGPLVHTGHRFPIEPKELDDWRAWQPKLVVGNASLPEGCLPPPLLRAERLSVRRNLLGMNHEVRTAAWLLPLADGRILGPSQVLHAARQEESSGPLSFAGREIKLSPDSLESFGELTLFQPTGPLADGVRPWSAQRLRAPSHPEDCLVFADLGTPPIPLSSGRFTAQETAWSIDPAMVIGEDLLGAAVVSRQDGALIGVIDFRDGQPVVRPIPQELVSDMDSQDSPPVK